MRNELKMKLEHLRCNWCYDLFYEILEMVDDLFEFSISTEEKRFLSSIKTQTLKIKSDVEVI